MVYEVAGLTKRYPGPNGGALANDRIDLVVETGEIVGIFGPNGAGKTTLVRQLMGLSRPTAGEIRLLGNDLVRDPSYAARHAAYFAQETYYFWYLTPWELLYITGRLRGLTSKEAREQARSLLDRFNLRDLGGRALARLSFGQARFVSLLSVFIGRRPVLILDEPTNELDPMHRKEFWDYLWEINSQEAVTVLLVTHNVHEAEHVVHRVLIVDGGRIIADGTPGDLKKGLEDQVRIEIVLASLVDPLPVFDHCERLPSKRNTLLFQTSRGFADAVVREAYQTIPHAAIADLRVVRSTLEDVYVSMVGKEWR